MVLSFYISKVSFDINTSNMPPKKCLDSSSHFNWKWNLSLAFLNFGEVVGMKECGWPFWKL